MAFPLAAMMLGASTIVAGQLTKQTVQSGLKSGLGQFAGSLPFGAGYSLGTYLGFPKNYQLSSTNQFNKNPTYYLGMPYGRYYNRRYSRYGRRRYGRYGRYRRYGRYYRRYV